MAMPEPGSAEDSYRRFTTGFVVIPFTVFWVSLFAYHCVKSVMSGNFGFVVLMVPVGGWFGFMSWAMLTYAFTGYYPRAFCYLYNALWGWLDPMPYPPPKQARHRGAVGKADSAIVGTENKGQHQQRSDP
jgi:hypothetical protein